MILRPLSKHARVLFLLTAALSSLLTTPTAAHAAPLNGIESSLTIYAYPPVKPIDWSTPRKALNSFLGNLLKILLSKKDDVEFVSDFDEKEFLSSNYKSSMGHTIGHVSCALPDGGFYERWVSLSGQDMVAVDKRILLNEMLGLGALFYDYVDGHIIAGAGNIARLTYYKGGEINDVKARPRYLQFEVDADHCARMKEMITFFESFHFPPGTTLADLERRHPEQLLYFTNTLDPYASYRQRMETGRGKVGGGCAPFGAALLKVGGKFRPEFDSLWKTPVTVSEKLIGIKDVRRVSLGSLLFSYLGSRWDYRHEGYANRQLSLYDPLKIWAFAGNASECLKGSKRCPAAVKALLSKEEGAVAKGETVEFRSFTKPQIERIRRRPRDSNEKGQGKVMQKVDGLVWKLR